LINPALAGATSRTLAEAAGGVSAQTALDLRERLLERAILVRKGTGLGWRPRGRREALDILVAGLTTTLTREFLAQMEEGSWAATFAQQGQYAYEDAEAASKQRLAAFRCGLGR